MKKSVITFAAAGLILNASLILLKRHWPVENEFHWHLDVSFGEDDSSIGATANENLRIARMIALELLKSEKSFSKGIKAKSRRCVRSDDYLEKVLLAGNF
jgi:hypothetical protein